MIMMMMLIIIISREDMAIELSTNPLADCLFEQVVFPGDFPPLYNDTLWVPNLFRQTISNSLCFIDDILKALMYTALPATECSGT